MDTNINHREFNSGGNRAEMIRQARECCSRNYYGNSMKSRKKIMEELAKKEKEALKEQETLKERELMNSKDKKKFVQENQQERFDVISHHTTRLTDENLKDISSKIASQAENSTFEDSIISPFASTRSVRNTTDLKDVVAKKQDMQIEDEDAVKSFHLLTVRCIVALVILVAVIAIDKSDVNYKKLNSQSVYESVTSSKSIEKIENFFVSFTKSE